MTNAEKFQKVFGYYATEMWAKPEKEFLEWINAEALEKETSCRNTRQVDLISRQDAIDCEYQVKIINDIEYVMLSEVQMKMRKLPSAQPKRGEWVQAKEVEIEYAVCTNCTHHGEFYMRYCPNCGADMRGDEE